MTCVRNSFTIFEERRLTRRISEETMKLTLSIFAFLLSNIALAAPPMPPPSQPSNPDYLYRDTNDFIPSESMYDFRQMFGIGGAYYGRKIEFVVVKAHSTNGLGQATMMINNARGGATQYIDGTTRDFFFMPDPNRDEMDIEVQLLKMYLKGSIVLEGIGVKFTSGQGYPPPPPPPPPQQPPLMEYGDVNTTFIGQGRVDIDRYVNLMRYRGYRLVSVVLWASSAQFPPIPGDVRFCTARGCSQTIKLTPNSREQRFNPRGVIVDQSARSWRFETNGGVSVDSFMLQFQR